MEITEDLLFLYRRFSIDDNHTYNLEMKEISYLLNIVIVNACIPVNPVLETINHQIRTNHTSNYNQKQFSTKYIH